ncbi:MAG: HTTM domain-containing protein [Pirellulales bacterium]|nr:HTTM domain-containing protein [Pirellulales bacterium]
MNPALKASIQRTGQRYWNAWDRFWFTPRLPHTLSAIRVATGLMLLYSHLVLASDLMAFLGDQAWVNNETARQLHDGTYGVSDWGRSYLWYFSSPVLIWIHHLFTLLVTAAFAAGLLTRITAPLAWALQLMYLHRLTGALFGLDQIVTYATMYLMLTPCGSCFSVDAWLRKRFAGPVRSSRRWQWLLPEAKPTVSANLATRLFQLHLCVIYLFGGLAKARGQTWWDGMAVWYSVSNYEYQSMDMTWLGRYPLLFSAMTHITLFWEIFYCALVWPKISRPLILALAVMVHGGIAMFLGMITFGVMMITANVIFIEPEWVMRWSALLRSRLLRSRPILRLGDNG